MTKEGILKYINETLGTNVEELEIFDWYSISINQVLSEDFIREMKDYVFWDNISQHQVLSESFIREFKDKVDWEYISQYQKLSESFIREFKDKVNWYIISEHQKLSEDFIREMKDYVFWSVISINQKLSEPFIREFQDKINWDWISKFQTLSEDLIREMKDYVSWHYISRYQKLSENFVIEFQDKVNWYYINENQKLSPNFFTDLEKNCTNFKYAWLKSWRRLTTEQKKKEIINTNLYECYENHFIAYKAVRLNRSSWFAPQRYIYLEGEFYESDADYSYEENSFGLSVWTEKQANSFGNISLDDNYLVLKVEVDYEDVARLVHDANKIRCIKFKVIS